MIGVGEGERVYVVGGGEVIGVELKVESLKLKERGRSR